MENKIKMAVAILFIIIGPLFAQYSFTLGYSSDSIVVDTTLMDFYLKLSNTGSVVDSFELDCRVIDSVPNWFVSYCAFGRCVMAGTKMSGYIDAGEFETLHVQVFPSQDSGMASINLHVRSILGSNLRDSLNVYAVYGAPGNYSFDFSCLDDTIKTDTALVQFQFRLKNTGTSSDTYALNLRVVDSIPGWIESYFLGGVWANPGTILKEYLGIWAEDTAIYVRVDPTTLADTEKLNLRVQSVYMPAKKDSINIYVIANPPGIQEHNSMFDKKPCIVINPNPFGDAVSILFDLKHYDFQPRLEIYNSAGQLVKCFDAATLQLANTITWYGEDNQGRKLPAGVYFLHFVHEKNLVVGKVILVR